MRVHVVSDVHGNADALARAGEGADALVVLGDLLDFVDYHQHERGIFGAIFGAEKVRQFAELRKGGRRGEAGAFVRSLWAGLADAGAVIEEAAREQYAALFGAMSAPTYATPGNVDLPYLWKEFAGPDLQVLDGDVAEIGGLRFGFVGGALLAPGTTLPKQAPWLPYLRSEQEYAEAVLDLTAVDVLCTHIPPARAELTYDVVARRAEFGSRAILEVIDRDQPRWSVFGHVHQPLARRSRIGRTECVNVGHFQRRELPYVLRW
ncbi:metallophosphoesterase family protein [Crossiella cryophila]|uniref:Icc-related predicted phosphoesterase n=1 Tax=Crossiella cryophila TaxID=43355 RepID=A0A7W7FTR1_9PSEU|nr:metallophosphoesterase [Crossiella cryophila]MBB4676688.1 Icc-related predicted phosphoesterase [Crossiella cryophila]